jgi:hypothetical protein
MGDPRRENWRYGHSIEWRSITIAIEHATSAPVYVRSVLKFGTRRRTRATGRYLRELARGFPPPWSVERLLIGLAL